MTDFPAWARAIRARTEAVLERGLPAPDIGPQRLHQAMRYAVLGGGKRVRALLAYAAGEFCGAEADAMDPVAAAVEMIHAYSLIHDDLPCMDDDDLRRGKPACHKQFGEATALLAGDALQSLAFQMLAEAQHVAPERQLANLALLAQACGSRGMAGGQAIDLDNVGTPLGRAELEFMHIHKTGALIRAAALLGAHSAREAPVAKTQAIDRYAKCIGLAFQVVDDILDEQGDDITLGKTAGKDARHNKPTYVTVLGLKESRAFAQTLHADALAAVAPFEMQAVRLKQIADFVVQRVS